VEADWRRGLFFLLVLVMSWTAGGGGKEALVRGREEEEEEEAYSYRVEMTCVYLKGQSSAAQFRCRQQRNLALSIMNL
jgi:hypothetical protein